jgi:hypothetical protein
VENLPFEFFACGNNAKQGPELEAHQVGMALLHAIGRDAPYEEILIKGNVWCPNSLKLALGDIWKTNQEYSLLYESLTEPVVPNQTEDEAFYNTLYWLCVIFDVDKSTVEAYSGNPVMEAVNRHLLGGDTSEFSNTGADVRRSGRKKTTRAESVVQFNEHRRMYGLCREDKAKPVNKYFARVQSVLSESGGLDLLFQLCDFDPKNRLTVEKALSQPFFECFQREPDTSTFPERLGQRRLAGSSLSNLDEEQETNTSCPTLNE